MRAFVNAPSDREIIFVRNATEAINLVAYAWGLANLGPGDVVLVTELEHHSNFVPVAVRREPHGRRVPRSSRSTTTASCVLDAARRIVDERQVVAAGLVSNSLGTINDIDAHRRLGARARRDPTSATPRRRRRTVRLDVQALGADFVAVSGHKMCGPSGIGFLWGRPSCCSRWSRS